MFSEPIEQQGDTSLIMDNARYQRCDKVMDKAKNLGIHLLYSPNLNLIERLWKFTKKQCLYNKYYKSLNNLKEVIDNCLMSVKTTFKQ
jgi:transposase